MNQHAVLFLEKGYMATNIIDTSPRAHGVPPHCPSRFGPRHVSRAAPFNSQSKVMVGNDGAGGDSLRQAILKTSKSQPKVSTHWHRALNLVPFVPSHNLSW